MNKEDLKSYSEKQLKKSTRQAEMELFKEYDITTLNQYFKLKTEEWKK